MELCSRDKFEKMSVSPEFKAQRAVMEFAFLLGCGQENFKVGSRGFGAGFKAAEACGDAITSRPASTGQARGYPPMLTATKSNDASHEFSLQVFLNYLASTTLLFPVSLVARGWRMRIGSSTIRRKDRCGKLEKCGAMEWCS